MEAQHYELVIRTQGPSASEWDRHRLTITALYQKRRLGEVMRIMRKEHQFHASVKMYKSRLGAWGVYKNNRRSNGITSMLATTAHKSSPRTHAVNLKMLASFVPRKYLRERDHKLEYVLFNIVEHHKYDLCQPTPSNDGNSAPAFDFGRALKTSIHAIDRGIGNQSQFWSALSNCCDLVEQGLKLCSRVFFSSFLSLFNWADFSDFNTAKHIWPVLQKVVDYCVEMARCILGPFHPLVSLVDSLTDIHLARYTLQPVLCLLCDISDSSEKVYTREAMCIEICLIEQLIDAGQLDSAQSHCEQILEHEQENLQLDPYDIVQAKYRLGCIYYKQGVIDRAEEMWLCVIESCSEADPFTASWAATRLGLLRLARLDYDGSERFSKLALALFLEAGDTEYPALWIFIENICDALKAQEKFDEMEEYRRSFWFCYETAGQRPNGDWTSQNGHLQTEGALDADLDYEFRSIGSVGNMRSYDEIEAELGNLESATNVFPQTSVYNRNANSAFNRSEQCGGFVEDLEDITSDNDASSVGGMAQRRILSDDGNVTTRDQAEQKQQFQEAKDMEVGRSLEPTTNDTGYQWMEDYFTFTDSLNQCTPSLYDDRRTMFV